MKWIVTATTLVVVAAVASGAGYWWGANKSTQSGATREQAGARPEKAATKAERNILFYRNPMGLPDTSPVPKKDSMGMDYTPVYEGEEPASDGSGVKISIEKVQKLGVRTEAAAQRDLIRTVRAVSTVQADERRLHTVAPRFEGWIERLYVNTTGQAVRKGDALMDVYSPELITAQQEYLIALQGVQAVAGGSAEVQAGMQRLVESSLQRLRNWNISESELLQLQKEGKARQYVTMRSPVSGVVVEKPSIQGKRFMPGEVLYQIADLSSVWVLADVFEQDLGMLRLNQPAAVKVDAYPDKVFNGKITFIYPTVTPETRTAKVRVELPNAQALLKPSMYARVEFASSQGTGKVLAVPESAVLDSGARQVVLVELGAGRFEPRAVKLGMRGDGYVEVQDGVKAGEAVVVSANFLIDAESNLKAALSGFSQGEQGAKPDVKAPAKPGANAAVAGPVTHRGAGSVEAVDPAGATVTLTHGPIASLKWPAMSMDFRVKDPALIRTLKPGQKIDFEFVDAGGGEYVVLRAQPAAAGHGAH
jgi:Cu(I)/Ag(I) efflux system membrane fusion protein